MCLPLSCLKIGFYSSSIQYNRNEIRSVFFKLCFCCHTFMVVRVKILMNSCLLEKHIGCFKWFDKFIRVLKKGKKKCKLFLNNNTYHCPYCLDETKEKVLVVPSCISFFSVKEIRFLTSCIHMKICLVCSKDNWSSLFVGKLLAKIPAYRKDIQIPSLYFIVSLRVLYSQPEYILNFCHICIHEGKIIFFCQATSSLVQLIFGGIT